MVASVAAQSITVSVGGVGLTQCLVSLEVGWDSYEQGSGLLLKKGTLTVCNVLGGPTLNPMNQDGFLPGKIVTIGGHPMVNIMRVLAPPEVSSINSGIPQLEGNLVVSIPIGCELAYRKTKEPDRDATGVTLGTPKNLGLVIVDLLTAAGIPGSNIGTISSDYSIDWPYSKNGGGFVELAGEFAYVSSGNGVSFLYCDRGNVINLKTIPNTATVSGGIAVTLGTNDRDYRWQLDSSLAPGEVEISGIRRYSEDISKEYPFTDTVIEEETIFTNEEVEQPGGGVEFVTTSTTVNMETSKTYYYAEEKLPSLNPYIFDFDPHYGFISISNRDYKSHSGTVTRVKQNGKQISVAYQFSLYDYDDRLRIEIQSQYVLARDMYPSDWEDQVAALDAGDIWDISKAIRIRNKADSLFPSQISVVFFKHNSSSVVRKVSWVFSNYYLLDRAASLAEQFSWAFDYSFNMVTKEYKKETWKQKNGRWVYSTETRSPVIVVNPGFQSNSETASIIRSEKLSMTSKATAPSSSTVLARDTQPPGITYWEGKFQIRENQLTGRAYFGTGENTKRYKVQSPFWMDTAQPDKFAQIEGQIINGRQYQHLVEADANSTSSDEPLIGASVAGNTFLADSLTWFHTPTETYVAFAGILTGGSGDTALGGGGFPTGLFNTPGGDGPLIDDDGDVVLDANGNVVSSGTITISGYAIGSTVRGVAYDI
jgi:hypothetical protein